MWCSSSCIASRRFARHVILHRVAVGGRLLVKIARLVFGREIGVEHFLDGLPDMQRIEHLHIGKAFEEDDAHGDLVGMLHLLDGFLAPLLGERLVAPIIEQAIMQPVLIDRRQLVTQRVVEIFDNFGLALHFFLRSSAQGVTR